MLTANNKGIVIETSPWKQSHTTDYSIDTDNDMISDIEELFIFNTNPNDPDTDGDGLDDKEEIELGTDPDNTDTDNDGLVDRMEVVLEQTLKRKTQMVMV